jgi:hypothetical protein
MSRGGFRAGAGRKSSWNNPETQLIRVPKIFAAQLLGIARALDQGRSIQIAADPDSTETDSVTDSLNQDSLNQIAAEILADETIVSTVAEQQVVKRAFAVFIERLLQ